ncbi:MAG TPA: autotransporter assembly complex family protein [Candidatus Polarisedimenticolaceae bacterium]|nr:autotransporter assembly complex family protein [Candidatus Polarisedimenticolaceae bacterium]
MEAKLPMQVSVTPPPARLRWTLASVLLAAGAALADEVDVRLEGLDGALEDNARAVLSIAAADREDRDLAPARIQALHEEAPDQIRRALEPFGHYRPAIESALEHEDTKWTATYRVTPGPQVHVRQVDVEVTGPGAEDPGFARRVREFPLQRGDPLVHARYEEGKAAFPAYASAHGYLDGRFERAEVQVDPEAGTADIVLHYASGPRFRYGEVRFRQEREAVDPAVLRDFVTFAPGEPIDLTELRALQGTLGQTPWFSRVEVRAEREQASGLQVPVEVDLVPAKPRFWRVAAGYGTDTGARLSVGLDVRRIGHEGHRAETDVLASQIERSAAVRYLVPGRNAATDVWTGTTGYREVDSDVTESRTALLGAALTRRQGRWNQTLGLRWQREDFVVGVDSGVSSLLFPEIGWTRIDTDDPIYPLHGRRLELRLMGADDAVLSDASFLQAAAQVRLVRSLGADLRVHGRLDVGSTATSDFHDLPATFRFFAGGDRSVRGYAYQALSPLDAQGTPIGGEVLLTTNLEVDWLPIERWGRWGIAAFHDWGNAAASFGSLDLERGVGTGLRWVSPVGMVRADVAWALDEPGRPTRFHFSIGPDL